jgi:hypothetical protein
MFYFVVTFMYWYRLEIVYVVMRHVKVITLLISYNYKVLGFRLSMYLHGMKNLYLNYYIEL